MKEIKLQFLYGHEFWDKLENLITNAKERVFLVSAYIGQRAYTKYINMIPKGIFNMTICRDDSGYIPYKALKIKQEYFHGKIYLIDNVIIIGSQNLNDAGKEGEFSTMIETDEFNASLILYQALLKIIEKEPILAEPVNAGFIELYENGCPFCGNVDIQDGLSLHICPGYGGGFVSEEDCTSYGGEGGCKYCLAENRHPIGEAICCDDSGCGLGISLDTFSLLHHSINPVNSSKEVLAKEYLRLFNFFESQGRDAIELFNKLGFVGQVFETTLERQEHELISVPTVKQVISSLKAQHGIQ